ncbi:hypothetical protein EVAR_20678_1 [Eumeta japonica]|uniref:Uncharacterized protein n=1 Tax=Eumeta variegata TaxID=151549 RepID=A0A4C1VCG7_EUMVA|nr:hypothetical protein EVAR_20678_1 [Eumeta japonica]
MPPVRQDRDTPICRKRTSGDSGRTPGGTVHATYAIGHTRGGIAPRAGGTLGGRIPDGPGAALDRRLFCFPGRDWQDDFPTAETEGSGTRRDPDCCHKTAS